MKFYIIDTQKYPSVACSSEEMSAQLHLSGHDMEDSQLLKNKFNFVEVSAPVNSKTDETTKVMVYKNDDGEVVSEWVSEEKFLEVANSVNQERSVKLQRDRFLSASDWTQLPDVPEETRTKWAEYRQALRDITTQSGYPLDVQWPATPK